jgi:hypothetical protein
VPGPFGLDSQKLVGKKERVLIFLQGIDITPPVNQAGRGLTDKPVGDRYQFHAKMSAKSANFLRHAI